MLRRQRRALSRTRLGLLAVPVLLAARAFAAVEAEKPGEYEVKSAFLFHFARLPGRSRGWR